MSLVNATLIIPMKERTIFICTNKNIEVFVIKIYILSSLLFVKIKGLKCVVFHAVLKSKNISQCHTSWLDNLSDAKN